MTYFKILISLFFTFIISVESYSSNSDFNSKTSDIEGAYVSLGVAAPSDSTTEPGGGGSKEPQGFSEESDQALEATDPELLKERPQINKLEDEEVFHRVTETELKFLKIMYPNDAEGHREWDSILLDVIKTKASKKVEELLDLQLSFKHKNLSGPLKEALECCLLNKKYKVFEILLHGLKVPKEELDNFILSFYCELIDSQNTRSFFLSSVTKYLINKFSLLEIISKEEKAIIIFNQLLEKEEHFLETIKLFLSCETFYSQLDVESIRNFIELVSTSKRYAYILKVAQFHHFDHSYMLPIITHLFKSVVRCETIDFDFFRELAKLSRFESIMELFMQESGVDDNFSRFFFGLYENNCCEPYFQFVNLQKDSSLIALEVAINLGKSALVEKILQERVVLDKIHFRGNEFLMEASLKGYVKIVKLLLEHNEVKSFIEEIDYFELFKFLILKKKEKYSEIARLFLGVPKIREILQETEIYSCCSPDELRGDAIIMKAEDYYLKNLTSVKILFDYKNPYVLRTSILSLFRKVPEEHSFTPLFMFDNFKQVEEFSAYLERQFGSEYRFTIRELLGQLSFWLKDCMGHTEKSERLEEFIIILGQEDSTCLNQPFPGFTRTLLLHLAQSQNSAISASIKDVVFREELKYLCTRELS